MRIQRWLPEPLRAALRYFRDRAFASRVPLFVRLAVLLGARGTPMYLDRMADETAAFDNQIDVHELPAIYHYWSNTYLRPELESFGYSSPTDFFYKELLAAAQRAGDRCAKFISLGAGNCDSEILIATQLRAAGCIDFVIECVDINPTMLGRGQALALESGVSEHIVFRSADINTWQPLDKYDVVMANQSLHHAANLEHLFDAVAKAIGQTGVFLTSDMIGRNGHMRWPEALAIVQEFWRELPKHKRYNVQLERHEKKFRNWDCSSDAFEGIRAQDILSLLMQRFHFEWFFSYANIIDPFIDRSFGSHFDPAQASDREFIDRIHARDEAEISAGNIKPTHMLAIMSRQNHVPTRHRRGLPPVFCVRDPQAKI